MSDKPWDRIERREGMKEVSEALEEIKIQLAGMQPNIRLIEKHDKTLYGNGQEGLTTKIDHIKGIRDDLKEHSMVDHRLFTLLIGLMGLTVFKLFVK